ncbi:hypothetical protein J7E88_05330 [Streptomyces sp. ISL-10]|uniref:hypothetical protein n=1 Tax=Streptomyces sp. ISL-10 TaxID=2819172 RepID=UPI001BEB02BA|nr:hypothetical protein [Streptomyces sp. ISL-10]MBT2364754.1 hypothetical protein [Streptomyces sp. ISL-10]
MDDLLRAWERIETWLREHQCTRALSELHPPASEQAVRSLQDANPYPLHRHLVQWLGIHGGAPCTTPPSGPAATSRTAGLFLSALPVADSRAISERPEN